MMFLILSLLSTAAFSQVDSTFLDGVVYLTTKPSPEASCEKDLPERCHHLSREACNLKKSLPERNWDIDDELAAKHVHALLDGASSLQIHRAYQAAIREAEVKTEANAGVSASDLNTLVNEVRTGMIREINASPIPSVVKGRMTDKMNAIKFQDGAEYIASMKRWFIDNQSLSSSAAEVEATKFYTGVCGNQGMEANAFYDSNVVGFVICPGMVQSLSEYGGSKAAFLNALSFTVGHELGHAIDTTLYPKTYQSMGDCHKGEGNFDWGHQSTEIVADFWGGRILAQRMREQQITDAEAVQTINRAQSYLCHGEGDDHHPAGNLRIDHIMGRDPQVRAQLECPPPSQVSPFCGINGRQTEQ